MEILEDIDWAINCPVKNATLKSTGEKLSKEVLDTIIIPLTESQESVTINFLMNDDCTFYHEKKITCPVTVKKALTFIYTFYQEPMKKEHVTSVYQGREDFYEDVLNSVDIVRNIDAFDDYCGLPFEGIEYNEGANVYDVLIGPS